MFFSVRYGHWHKDKAQQTIKNVPRLIVFVVGGKLLAFYITKPIVNIAYRFKFFAFIENTHRYLVISLLFAAQKRNMHY